MVGLSKKRVFPKTKGDSITGQDRAQKHCDFRFSQIEKKSKVAVLQLPTGEHAIFFRGTREQVPYPPLPWEGLNESQGDSENLLLSGTLCNLCSFTKISIFFSEQPDYFEMSQMTSIPVRRGAGVPTKRRSGSHKDSDGLYLKFPMGKLHPYLGLPRLHSTVSYVCNKRLQNRPAVYTNFSM